MSPFSGTLVRDSGVPHRGSGHRERVTVLGEVHQNRLTVTDAAAQQRRRQPVVDFGLSATEYIEDISIDLEAGISPWYSYQWQDTVTTHNYHVVKELGLNISSGFLSRADEIIR
jgi:hypothetical protein